MIDNSTLLESDVKEPADTQHERQVHNRAAIDLLNAWGASASTDDEREQQETWQHLQTVLDEDRLSSRKLFPSE